MNQCYTLSGRTGKVVASHDAVTSSIPAEAALIYTIHEALIGCTAHEGVVCHQSIGSIVSDAIVRRCCGRLQLGVPHWAASVDYCK